MATRAFPGNADAGEIAASVPLLIGKSKRQHVSSVSARACARKTDTSVVEQQVDLVGLVAVGNLVAKTLDLRPVGDIGDVRRDPQPLRQSRRLAQPLRFR